MGITTLGGTSSATATALIAAVNYDPTTADTYTFSALSAMTALDTTNLRLTFTAPTSGKVIVRLAGATKRASTTEGSPPDFLVGVLSGATVVGRQSPQFYIADTNDLLAAWEARFPVTGLTGGNTYTWDAAYAVRVTSAGNGILAGGPNTATAATYGGLAFEVYS